MGNTDHFCYDTHIIRYKLKEIIFKHTQGRETWRVVYSDVVFVLTELSLQDLLNQPIDVFWHTDQLFNAEETHNIFVSLLRNLNVL